MKNKYDVVIIGAGAAGLYFGWKMAEKGFSVMIFDKSTKDTLGIRLDSFHIDSEKFSIFDIPSPKESDPDLITTFKEGISKSPYDHYPKTVEYPFHVMRYPQFLQRLIQYATQNGAEIEFSSEFLEFILEEKKIVGIRVKTGTVVNEYQAKIVVDASGMRNPIRTKLLENYGVETFDVAPDEQFYVILRYINWKKESKPNIGWTFYKTWIAPAPKGYDAILGIGQPLSFDKGEAVLQDFLQTISIPEFEVKKFERGSTPYRRPPYSMVADGFLILGDAACITKPFSGEGVTAGWTLAKIAIEELSRFLKSSEYVSRELLWPINVRYQRDQGAKFASLLAQIPAAANTTKKENEYLFKHDIIFSSEDLSDMNRTFQLNLPLKKLLRIICSLLWGLLTGNYSYRNLKSMINSLGISGKIRTHYEKYPENPKDYPEWETQAINLWAKIPKMK
jgi:digeranylgeranylglycerophospholipid reductase